MRRLNLTLDEDTSFRLEKHAAEVGAPRAAVAREILRQGLERHERRRFLRQLATAYAAGREDARRLLRDLEAGELELMGDEEG